MADSIDVEKTLDVLERMAASQESWAENWDKTGIDATSERSDVTLLRSLASQLPALLSSRSDAERPKVDRDFLLVGADRMAGAIARYIHLGALDSRSTPADAMLDYAFSRHGQHEPVQAVERRYDEIMSRLRQDNPDAASANRPSEEDDR